MQIKKQQLELDMEQRTWNNKLVPNQKGVRQGWSHHFMGNRWGNSVRLYFLGAPKSLQMVIAAMKLKDAYTLEGKL